MGTPGGKSQNSQKNTTSIHPKNKANPPMENMSIDVMLRDASDSSATVSPPVETKTPDERQETSYRTNRIIGQNISGATLILRLAGRLDVEPRQVRLERVETQVIASLRGARGCASNLVDFNAVIGDLSEPLLLRFIAHDRPFHSARTLREKGAALGVAAP